MSEQSLKTRSEASSSSRVSEARQKAALAQLHLSQTRRASQLEQLQLQKKMELERRVERQKMELEKQKMELMELERRLKEQELELAAEMKERAAADHAEVCELEARLIEEEENGGVTPAASHPRGTAASVRAECVLTNRSDSEQKRSTMNDAGQATRCMIDQDIERPHEAISSHSTWIDTQDTNAPEPTTAVRGAAGARPCQLPPLTLEKFDGDPLQWPRWIALFKALVHDRRELSDTERLIYLQSSLTGPAQLAVSGLLYDGSFYNEALQELQYQFGDRATVVRESLDSVLHLPNVQENDISSLTELSRVLNATVSVLTSLEYAADLAASTNVTAVVAKLPVPLAWKWGEHLQTTERREPTLSDLNKWLRSQVSAARVVVRGAATQTDGGREAGRRHWGHKPISQDRASRVSVMATAVTTGKGRDGQCELCSGAHEIANCDRYTCLSVDERVVAAMRRAMCFRCLKSGHRARECDSAQKCSSDDCGSRRHHRLLHGMTEINRYL